MEDLVHALSNVINVEEVNRRRIAEELVLSLVKRMNMADFCYTVQPWFGFSSAELSELDGIEHKRVEKLFRRYQKYKKPYVTWWFLGYFRHMSPEQLGDFISQVMEEDIDELDITHFLTRFKSFDASHFDESKLFRYDKNWYRVTFRNIQWDDSTTLNLTCEVKLTDEEVHALGVNLCKPILFNPRNRELNRKLVDYHLAKAGVAS